MDETETVIPIAPLEQGSLDIIKSPRDRMDTPRCRVEAGEMEGIASL